MKKNFLGILILSTLLTSCTKQERVKNYGSSMNCKLAPGQKLINVTWKEDNFWVLTRPMKPTDSAEIYTFSESASLGKLNGKVTIYEVMDTVAVIDNTEKYNKPIKNFFDERIYNERVERINGMIVE